MKRRSILLLLCLLGGCAKTIEVGNERRTVDSSSSAKEGKVTAVLNKASIEQKDNVIEIYQEFQIKNEENEWLSMIHPLEVDDVSFIRMSAFSMASISFKI